MAVALLPIMFLLRYLSVNAARREREQETARIKAIIAKVKAARIEEK